MFENIRLSLQGILSHKIRSFLTMLGIIIGIAAIIAIVSIIAGTNEQIKNNLIGAGNNTVDIKLVQGDWDAEFNRWNPVPDNIHVTSEKQRERIEALDEVESCTLYRRTSDTDSLYYLNTRIDSASVYGVDEKFFDTLGYVVTDGIGFSENQYHDFSKVALIDTVLARGIFTDGENPVGKIIDINDEPFRIIGVVSKRSSFEPVINSIDDYFTYHQSSAGMLFIPTEDWGIVYSYDYPQNCTVKAVDTDAMTQAGRKTADILNENIKAVRSQNNSEEEPMIGMEGGGAYEYKSANLLEQAKALQDLSKSTNNMLIWIASISLLVGGIGVMNIMLVSVTERTREIGLKKALGARKTRILAQFLTEAVVLTSIGGLIGVITGIGLAQIVANIAAVPVAISGTAIAVSVIFSMVVGIVFGLLPSVKAANLNPIDALRYE